MRCLFCKENSDGSRSVEHIIPESLGNTKYVLPAGVVCDKCNNYFSRKIEKPFFDLEAIMWLRFNQGIPSKKNKIPLANAILPPNHPVIVKKHVTGDLLGTIEMSEEAIDEIKNQEKFLIIFKGDAPLPNNSIISKFVGKVALEAMAQRLVAHEDGLEYLVDETQLDPLRYHVRRGEPVNWSVNIRRIYEVEKKWGAEDDSFQVLYEYDILKTEENEMYFVMAIFGLEFAINYGEPSLDGYLAWLEKNDDISPLHIEGKGGFY